MVIIVLWDGLQNHSHRNAPLEDSAIIGIFKKKLFLYGGESIPSITFKKPFKYKPRF